MRPRTSHLAASARAARRRRDRGLATLEWLMVVAVAALMAALVLAHVQRNVERGVSQIADASDGGPDSTRTLDRAQSLADELAHRVQVQSIEYDPYDYRFQDPVFWSEHFSTRCQRIREVFADLEAEGVTVAVESDFRMGDTTILNQRIEPIALGEIPWIYGNLDTSSPRRDSIPAFTVCQVFLSQQQTYGLTP